MQNPMSILVIHVMQRLSVRQKIETFPGRYPLVFIFSDDDGDADDGGDDADDGEHEGDVDVCERLR